MWTAVRSLCLAANFYAAKNENLISPPSTSSPPSGVKPNAILWLLCYLFAYETYIFASGIFSSFCLTIIVWLLFYERNFPSFRLLFMKFVKEREDGGKDEKCRLAEERNECKFSEYLIIVCECGMFEWEKNVVITEREGNFISRLHGNNFLSSSGNLIFA